MKEIIVAPQKRALYFGFIEDYGHGLRSGHKKIYAEDVPGFPWSEPLLDTGLLKNGKREDVVDGHVFWTAGGAKSFWYAFFWWDRSGDKRANSNSGFFVEGFGWNTREDLTPRDEAFAFALAQYPDIVARQRFPLVLQP